VGYVERGVNMVEQYLGTIHPVVEKLNATPRQTAAVDRSELKRRIAETVRADSNERLVPTQERAIQELAPELTREELSAVLSEMGADASHADIKAIVAPSGRVYLFSEGKLTRNDAAERCFLREAKLAIVEKIRRDSQLLALTAAADLGPLFPSAEPGERAAFLAEVKAEFRDIQTATGPRGEEYLHSDLYVSGNYGKIMTRAQQGDAGRAIAELVRDRSREMPAPTKVTLFNESVFRLSAEQIQSFLDGLESPAPELADIKKLVHPETGALYLYSDRWLPETVAFQRMDWEEVGALRNP
jgi:hypothetical protein